MYNGNNITLLFHDVYDFILVYICVCYRPGLACFGVGIIVVYRNLRLSVGWYNKFITIMIMYRAWNPSRSGRTPLK